MKNRNLILSVLFWVIAIYAFAVKLMICSRWASLNDEAGNAAV